jgi:hypothetical protein
MYTTVYAYPAEDIAITQATVNTKLFLHGVMYVIQPLVIITTVMVENICVSHQCNWICTARVKYPDRINQIPAVLEKITNFSVRKRHTMAVCV